MTVPASLNHRDENDSSSIFIACLVTDKKYRKMGGEAGLKAAIKHTANRRIRIGQLPAEEFLNDGDDHFESNLMRFIRAARHHDDQASSQQVILVHKYSDFYKLPVARDRVDKLRSWLHDQTAAPAAFKILDDPARIDLLSDRVMTGNLVRQLCAEEGFESRGLQWPAFAENPADLEGAGLAVPVIVKPVDACATDESHWMTLIRDASAYDSHWMTLIRDASAHDSIVTNPAPPPTLTQQFYEHYSVLYKVYVIGSEVIEIVARPSISASHPVIRFNTHKFKAAEGDLSPAHHHAAMHRLAAHKDLILDFTRRLKTELGLTWFGVDVIIPEKGAGIKVAVIDVNYMPGYDGITGLPDKLIKAILE